MSCIFCRIVSGDIPAEVVAREEHALAFLDVSPLGDGHVLVIPTAHHRLVEELPESTAVGLFSLVRRVAGAAREAVGAAGSTIAINNGDATGQTVPHCHVHIVPRFEGDGAGSVHSVFPPGDRQPVDQIGTRVRAALEDG